MHELFSPSERDSLRELIRGRAEKQKALDLKSVKLRFMKWVEHNENIKKMILEEEQRLKVIEILKSSHRGHRSTMEKETIRRFLVNNLTCLPKTISFSEMDKLCNEIDWFPLIGRSILFLQGDFGNVYYMIARGTVGLYLEPSKDREMTIAREFGNMRAQAFYGTDEDLKRLGNNIFNLSVRIGINRIHSSLLMDGFHRKGPDLANMLFLLLPTRFALVQQSHLTKIHSCSLCTLIHTMRFYDNITIDRNNFRPPQHSFKSFPYLSNTTTQK